MAEDRLDGSASESEAGTARDCRASPAVRRGQLWHLESWSKRYQRLIELGHRLSPLAETKRIDANRLHGCQGGVRLVADYRDGRLDFEATGDFSVVAALTRVLFVDNITDPRPVREADAAVGSRFCSDSPSGPAAGLAPTCPDRYRHDTNVVASGSCASRKSLSIDEGDDW